MHTPRHDVILGPIPVDAGRATRKTAGLLKSGARYRTLYSTGDLTEHALIDRSRRRSLGFLDWEQETWSCSLVTFVGRDGQWHGHLAFRPQDSDRESDEVRTADIFIEASESEIDHKARGLGRPLFRALLSSSVHTSQEAEARASPRSATSSPSSTQGASRRR